MAKARLERRLVVRVSEPLLDQLETAAAEENRPVSGMVRHLLVASLTERSTAREREGAARQ